MTDGWIYTTTGHEQNKHLKAKHFELFLQKTNQQRSDVTGLQYANWMKYHIQQFRTTNGLSGTGWLYGERADDFIVFLENSESH